MSNDGRVGMEMEYVAIAARVNGWDGRRFVRAAAEAWEKVCLDQSREGFRALEEAGKLKYGGTR